MDLWDIVNKTLLFARVALLPCGRHSDRAARRLLSYTKKALRALAKAEGSEGLATLTTKRARRLWVRDCTSKLASNLPSLREALGKDVVATQLNDPAAKGEYEIVLCYPGIAALLAHRIAHILYEAGAPILARLISESAHSKTGIDIHPGAKIGAGCAIDHGSGIVIGETAEVGKGVTIYHGVTLGAKNPKEERGKKRHPTIGNHVTLYAYATILGGDTIISDGVSIPSGSRITHSI